MYNDFMAGRPYRNEDEKLSVPVMIRVTRTQKQFLEEAADSAQRTLADWARLKLIDAAKDELMRSLPQPAPKK